MAMRTPSSSRGTQWPGIAARLILGGLLVYAGINKQMDVPKLIQDVANFRLLPGPLDRVLAIVLPWNEIVIGGLLIFGIWLRPAALAALFLFIVFAIAVGSAIARHLNIECGCLGNADASKVGFLTLGKDAIGLGLGLYIYARSATAKTGGRR